MFALFAICARYVILAIFAILETFEMFTTIAFFEISAIFVLLALTMATLRIFSSVSTLGFFNQVCIMIPGHLLKFGFYNTFPLFEAPVISSCK